MQRAFIPGVVFREGETRKDEEKEKETRGGVA